MGAAIVFDMDGVLADTERLELRSHRAAAEALGGRLSREVYRSGTGGVHEDVTRVVGSRWTRRGRRARRRGGPT